MAHEINQVAEHSILRITDRLFLFSCQHVCLNQNALASPCHPIRTDRLFQSFDYSLRFAKLQINICLKHDRITAECRFLTFITNMPAELACLTKHFLLHVRTVRQHKMIQPQKTDLKQKRVAGIILLHKLPALFHHLFKWMPGKISRKFLVYFTNLLSAKLRLIPD